MEVVKKILILTGMMLIFMVGCSALNISQNSEESNRLVLYSGRSETLVGPIIERFSEVSGIEVEVRYGSTAEMAATILEEGQNSPADVFFAQDPGGLGALAQVNMFSQLPVHITEMVDPRFVSADNFWIGVSGRARVIVYNTDSLSPEDLPDSLWGFTDPKWKDRIGLPPTNGSFQTMVTGMRFLWGEEKTREWLQGILANEPIYYEKNTPTMAAVASGEVEIGFVNHYYLHRFLAEEGLDFTARNHYLSNGDIGSLVMVSGVGILANSENQTNAQIFVEFLLSEEAQKYFSSETYEYPLAENIDHSADLPSLISINVPNISLSELSDLEGTIDLLQEVGMLP